MTLLNSTALLWPVGFLQFLLLIGGDLWVKAFYPFAFTESRTGPKRFTGTTVRLTWWTTTKEESSMGPRTSLATFCWPERQRCTRREATTSPQTHREQVQPDAECRILTSRNPTPVSVWPFSQWSSRACDFDLWHGEALVSHDGRGVGVHFCLVDRLPVTSHSVSLLQVTFLLKLQKLPWRPWRVDWLTSTTWKPKKPGHKWRSNSTT